MLYAQDFALHRLAIAHHRDRYTLQGCQQLGHRGESLRRKRQPLETFLQGVRPYQGKPRHGRRSAIEHQAFQYIVNLIKRDCQMDNAVFAYGCRPYDLGEPTR